MGYRPTRRLRRVNLYSLSRWHKLESMLTHFPKAVPEIPVSHVDKAAEYYVNVLGFHFDWGNDQGGIGGISQR